MMDVVMKDPTDPDHWVAMIDGIPVGGFETEQQARSFKKMIRASNLGPYVYPDGELVWRNRRTRAED